MYLRGLKEGGVIFALPDRLDTLTVETAFLRNNKHFVLFCLAVFYGLRAYSLVDVAATGDWSDAGTWQSNTAPASGDTLVIPGGVTVTVDCNCGTYASMHIVVYGTLDFPGGRKINLSSNGLIDVYPGATISGANPGDKIIIDGSTVWDGGDPDIEGPSTCGSSGCETNTALPVELLGFRCAADGTALRFTWETASEVQNDFFTLSRSADLERWEEVGIIRGAGYSKAVMYYEFFLFSIDSRKPYYRLSQTDFDGHSKHVATLIYRQNSDRLRVFPNPSDGVVNIEIPEGSGIERVFIYGADGRLRFEQPVWPQEQVSYVRLEIDAPGVYHVQVKGAGIVYTQVLLIQ